MQNLRVKRLCDRGEKGRSPEYVVEKEKTELKIHPYKFDFDGIYFLSGDSLDKFNKYIDRLSAVIADNKALSAYFDAWCARYGYDYAKYHMRFSEEMLKDNSQMSAGPRNLYTCEAHNELLKNFLILCYENRVEEAKVLLKEIEELQSVMF